MNPESEPPESDVNGHVGRIAIWEADAQLREALRTLLAPYSSVWALEFLTTDGATRERIKSHTSLDILVVTDSASLAQRQSLVRCVQDEKPDIVRVVCSHYSDAVTALLSVPFAHSAIDNPFDGDVLARGLSRAIRLRQTMACSDVRRLIGSTNAMPAVPKTYSELVSALADSTTGILQVTEIIEQDVGMSARIRSTETYGCPRRSRRLPRRQRDPRLGASGRNQGGVPHSAQHRGGSGATAGTLVNNRQARSRNAPKQPPRRRRISGRYVSRHRTADFGGPSAVSLPRHLSSVDGR